MRSNEPRDGSALPPSASSSDHIRTSSRLDPARRAVSTHRARTSSGRVSRWCDGRLPSQRLAFIEEDWIIARYAATEKADGKIKIDSKSLLCRASRLILQAERSEAGREPKMRERIISVGFDAAQEPMDCFRVGTELQLGKADPCEPPVGERIARREAECFTYVGFSLSARPMRYLALPMCAWASAKLRSNANARSNSAIVTQPFVLPRAMAMQMRLPGNGARPQSSRQGWSLVTKAPLVEPWQTRFYTSLQRD